MVKFHVTRGGKIHHKGVAQPEGAIIELDEKQLPHLKGFGYVEGSSAAPGMRHSLYDVDTQNKSTLPEGQPKSALPGAAHDPQSRMDAVKAAEETYPKPGTPKK